MIASDGMPGAGALLGGRYLLGGELGQGGIGIVYDAVDQSIGRRVAVKLIRPDRFDGEVLTRFHLEARAAAGLNHPNIVQITDFQRTPDGSAFLVMEYLEGQTLSGLLASVGPLAPERVASIAGQTLDALGAAHRANLVHRDVKPANVFLVSLGGVRDLVKLLDFGTAKLTHDAPLTNHELTASGVVVGTPAYMAPEQARGATVTPATDVFAVGVTMYCALTARRPFDAASYNAVIAQILLEEPPPIASLRGDVPPGLLGIVERAMRKDPSQRFQSAEEMRAALAPFARASGTRGLDAPAPTSAGSFGDPAGVMRDAHAGAVARGTPPVARPGGASSGTRGKLMIGGVLALTVAAAVAVGVWLGRPGASAPPRPAASREPSGVMQPVAVVPTEGGAADTPPVEREPGDAEERPEAAETQARASSGRPAQTERPRSPSGDSAGAISEADRAAIRRLSSQATRCAPEAGEAVRSTAVLTIGPDGRQQGGIRFSPPVPDSMVRCFAMFSLQTPFEPGRTRTLRVPVRVSAL